MTPTAKQTGEATVRAERSTGETISHGVLLAVCCLLSYKIITVLLTVSRFLPRDDELLGGMWAAGGWIALKFPRLIPNQSTVLGHAHKESIRS